MKTSTSAWLHGLISAIVTGLSTSFLSALGITGANTVGLSIPTLSWRQLAVLTVIGGLVGAAAYLKQSPVPPEDPPPPPQCPPINVPTILAMIGCIIFTGCATVKEHEPKAAEAARWIELNSGLIQNGAQMVAVTVIYSTTEGDDRQKVIEAVHAVSSNLSALLSGGKTDPQSVRDALRIKEPWFLPLADSVANLYEQTYWKGLKNGYADCGASLLRSLMIGLRDATESGK